MYPLRAVWRRVERTRRLVRMLRHLETARGEHLLLRYPPDSWYAENAGAMLQVAEEIAGRLDQELGLRLPARAECLVTDPDTARAILDTTGAALGDSAIVGFGARRLSEFALIAAHEMAHVASRGIGPYGPPFKGEGFACYAAESIGFDAMPCGVPLHCHVAWMLSVGIHVRLAEMWERRDYAPELYDAAWSFAAFVVDRYGLCRYLALYASRARCLEQRLQETLGVSAERLERQWHRHAAANASLTPAQTQHIRRHIGVLCSRARWLHSD